jgi:hypothetical protein
MAHRQGEPSVTDAAQCFIHLKPSFGWEGKPARVAQAPGGVARPRAGGQILPGSRVEPSRNRGIKDDSRVRTGHGVP